MSVRARIIDAFFWIVGTLLLKKAFPKLTENAVTSWVDDKIGEFLGWSAPDVSTILSWVWPAVVVALILWGYHEFYSRLIRDPPQSSGDRFSATGVVYEPPQRAWIQRVEPSHIIILGLVIAGVGVAWQTYRGPTLLSTRVPGTTTQPVEQTVSPTPVLPKYDPAKKAELDGLMLTISRLLNKEGLEILQSQQSFFLADEVGTKDLKAHLEFITDMQKKVDSLYQQIFNKLLPENRFFERDLKFVLGTDTVDTNPVYQLQQRLGSYHSQIHMVLTIRKKISEDDPSADNQLFNMARGDLRTLRGALKHFGEWIASCNARIDEQTR
jgi:hypothetical protein